jgi:hypothetical protein
MRYLLMVFLFLSGCATEKVIKLSPNTVFSEDKSYEFIGHGTVIEK